MTPDRPFENSYWVIPGRFLAGEYPGNHEEDTHRKLADLVDLGVDTFIDLTEPDERAPYQPWLPTLDASGKKAIHHQRHAIRDFDVPDVRQMIEILDAIDRALSHGRIVYLHCRGGIGRTGTVVGCWLARHGESGEFALERLSSLRRVIAPYLRAESPETDAQRSMIRHWKE